MNAEFGGVGFAMGVVRGTRAFNVDTMGRLLGVTYPQIWTPGENIATCRKKENQSLKNMFSWMPSIIYGIDPEPEEDNTELVENFLGIKHPAIDKAMEELKAKKEADKAADKLDACNHGFYGYYEGSNDWKDPQRVNAVIEGYGEVVVGTRGFRAMKARIVALHIPKKFDSRKTGLILRNYSAIPAFNSFNQMVGEFQPDAAGLESTPENDPEFWTRSV